MSDQQHNNPDTPKEGAETASAATDTEPSGTDTTDAGTAASGADSARNEAAKYRRKLRDAEADRDQWRQRAETLQRAEAERRAAAKLADGADIWRDGATVADMLDDDGTIDAAKVDNVVTGLLAAHPHWAVKHFAAAPASEVTSSDKITGDGTPTRTWGDLLQTGATRTGDVE